MQYAITTTGERTLPSPEIHAICPGCKDTLIPKCGSINIWHFAHKNKDCDPWYEPESKWHRDWKEFWPIENREVVIGNHRADIKTKGGTVVELQNSSISSQEIQERERFYDNMIWVVNAETFWENIYLRDKEDYHTFLWKYPRKCWLFAKKPIYLDIGHHYPTMLFKMKKIHPGLPCRGWGQHLGKEYLLENLGIDNYDVYKL